MDAFEFWGYSRGKEEATSRMIRLIQKIADTARALLPGSLLVPQNGECQLDLDTAGVLQEIVSG